MLELIDVSKSYGSVRVLSKISQSKISEKTVVLLGSSGSGKSTLLRAILGLHPIDQGSILIQGAPIAELSPRARAEKMGYVPQDGGLFPHLTAQGNITLAARSLKWSNDRVAQRLGELSALEFLSPELLGRFPVELSGGQRQRVALLRSLFLDPGLILMDEPFGALDPLVRNGIQTEMKALFSRLKKTVVFVTHDVGEASFLADEILLMHEGRIVQAGKMNDLIKNPSEPFVTKFLNAQRVLPQAAGVI
ncbi:MAG: ATP-binding cassette domain-containing protein [Proteobacteria bacterium]|nr:MAG: ATP-binding cassette domain-containing protein [Pseudomonadota bacterium]